MVEKPTRDLPKVTLRDLFAVVTIVAIVLGWLADRSQLAREITRCDIRYERLASSVLKGLDSGKLQMGEGAMFGDYDFGSDNVGYEFRFDQKPRVRAAE